MPKKPALVAFSQRAVQAFTGAGGGLRLVAEVLSQLAIEHFAVLGHGPEGHPRGTANTHGHPPPLIEAVPRRSLKVKSTGT
jgi:hypothetical protein